MRYAIIILALMLGACLEQPTKVEYRDRVVSDTVTQVVRDTISIRVKDTIWDTARYVASANSDSIYALWEAHYTSTQYTYTSSGAPYDVKCLLSIARPVTHSDSVNYPDGIFDASINGAPKSGGIRRLLSGVAQVTWSSIYNVSWYLSLRGDTLIVDEVGSPVFGTDLGLRFVRR